MTFNTRRKVETNFIQLKADGTQTGASDGDKVLFPTKTTTGGDAVSISSGVISLSSSRSYYIQINVGVDRPSSSSDVSFEFWNDTASAKLLRTSGAFEARYLPTVGGINSNGSTFGQLTIDNPSFDISVKINQLGVGNTADILENCHLFIVEMEY